MPQLIANCIFRSVPFCLIATASVALLSTMPLQTKAQTLYTAGDCPQCLGRPLNIESTASFFPLSGFRVGLRKPLRAGGRPEVFFVGETGLSAVNIERWPLVKALGQFGTWSGVRGLDPTCGQQRGPFGQVQVCTPATLDLSHAGYRSRYVSLVTRSVIGSNAFALRPGPGSYTAAERYLLSRYLPLHQGARGPLYINGSKLPLVAIGRFVQTFSQILTEDAFFHHDAATSSERQGPVSPLSFAAVHTALLEERDPTDAEGMSHLVEDVNAEANVITALICATDQRRPAGVCNRPAIRAIMRSVK